MRRRLLWGSVAGALVLMVVAGVLSVRVYYAAWGRVNETYAVWHATDGILFFIEEYNRPPESLNDLQEGLFAARHPVYAGYIEDWKSLVEVDFAGMAEVSRDCAAEEGRIVVHLVKSTPETRRNVEIEQNQRIVQMLLERCASADSEEDLK